MSEIRVERDGHVATIVLAAPQRRNALTPEMAADLVEACETVDADASIGAVVIRGEGDGFCAGAHRETLGAVGADPAKDELYKRFTAVYAAFARVGEILAPTVAAIRGACVGAGVNLAMAPDLRVIAHDARIIAGFLPLGIHPGGGHFALLGRSGGREAAAGIGLFAEEIDGRRAVELGMAWVSLPGDQVEARAGELAHRIAADPELARASARSMRLELGPPALPWPAALQAETATQMWSMRRAHDRRSAGA